MQLLGRADALLGGGLIWRPLRWVHGGKRAFAFALATFGQRGATKRPAQRCAAKKRKGCSGN